LDGNKYLDMSIGGIGANILGYADPDVDKAVIEAIQAGSSSSLNCPEEVLLAEKLCDLPPWADMARFTRSGGEAMAVAVRIARAATGKDAIAFCGYHGWHDWYLAANVAQDGEEDSLGGHLIAGLKPKGVPGGLANTAFPFGYNQPEELEKIVTQQEGNLAAIVMEPIRSQSPDDGFLERVRELADACGAVLIMDEISAGFRLCTGGAHMVLSDVRPDIAVFSKALGNGYPIAAVIGRESVMGEAENTFISSTCWTERTGYVAALAVIEKHQKESVASRLNELGSAVQAGWREIAAKHGVDIDVSGIKPMSHFSFVHNKGQALKALFIQTLLDKGLLASNLFYAMNAHSNDDVARYLDECDGAFGLLAESIACDDIEDRLIGKPASAGFQRLA